MKEYAKLTMLLMILLVIMPIASKSVDLQPAFSIELRDFIVETRSSQPLKTKSIIGKEVAEGIQKRRFTESKVVINLTAFPPSDIFISRGSYLEIINDKSSLRGLVRNQVESISILKIDTSEGTQSIPSIYENMGFNSIKVTNYIRYL